MRCKKYGRFACLLLFDLEGPFVDNHLMIHDLAVIGTGIVGLSTAFNFLKQNPGKKVLLLEKESTFGRHQSGHNSGVLHSGIYYKPGSHKAKNCQEGYQKMLSYCDEKNIPYELCGKVIVATSDEQLPGLETIWQRGLDNGLEGLERLSKEQVMEIEPHVRCVAGIKVPQAGIVDYKQVSKSLYEDLLQMGAQIEFQQPVRSVVAGKQGVEIEAASHFQVDKVVNCAGLYSDRLAKKSGMDMNVRIIPFRGEYYDLKKDRSYLVKNLIYPVPDINFPFLGVHFTRRLDGSVEAGPNAVFAFHREGYRFSKFKMGDVIDSLSWPGFRKLAMKHWRYGFHEIHRSLSKKTFTESLQALIPEIQMEDIVSGGAGVRAQACFKDGNLCDDFLILNSQKNITHVCNAPSPAATSSLAIGESIVDWIHKN